MVQIIAGKKGKGKTKHLLDKANAAITEAKGSIVYLDKSSKHMYELSNKIRLINVKGFDVTDSSGFIGFISGIISQELACLEGLDISETISRLEDISEKYHVTFVLSVSMDADELPEDVKKDVIISL